MEMGEALMFDEACLAAVEINNQLSEEKKKKENASKKREAEFQKDMNRLFENEDGEILI